MKHSLNIKKISPLGNNAESIARKFLEKNSLKFIESNFRCRFGEIDLVMRDHEFIVFAEVRYRKSSAYGSAAESVNYSKQQKLKKTGIFYLCMHKLLEKIPCRFDVVALEGCIEDPKILWFKQAFDS